MPVPSKVLSALYLIVLFVIPLSAVPSEANRVHLTLDTSEADQVLAILALRSTGKSIDDSRWQMLFATEPYQRLKARQTEIAKLQNNPSVVLTDEKFKEFVLSDELLARASELRNTLERWKQVNLQATGQNVLSYLPASAAIHAKVFPVIKPGSNSFVWESSAIFLYLDPDVSAAKFTNTVAHELHHIGLASAQADYDARIQRLPERARTAAKWVGAFGEGWPCWQRPEAWTLIRMQPALKRNIRDGSTTWQISTQTCRR
jgi:Putative zinc dependent peptidase (DUF5700)